MTVEDIQRKLQRGRRLLAKAEDDRDLLGSALSSIHGALEDACRMWLFQPNLRQQHGVDVYDKSKASWKTLLGLTERYCGWSQQDVRYVSRMNSLRNRNAHGDDYTGTRKDVEGYLYFVEREIARRGVSIERTSGKFENESAEVVTLRREVPVGQTNGSGFAKLWFFGTIAGLFVGVFLAHKIADFIGIPLDSVGESEEILSSLVAFGSLGLAIGTIQGLLLLGKIKQVWQWIIVTVMGYGVPVILSAAMDLAIGKYNPALREAINTTGWRSFILMGCAYGAFVGFCQWLVLKKHFHRAGSWIVVSALSYGFGFLILGGLNGFALSSLVENKKVK